MYKTIIFDFDGTIVDSMAVILRVYSSLSSTHSLKELSDEDIAKLKNMTPFEVIKFLDIPFYKIPQLLFEAKNKYKDYLSDLKPVPGLPFVLIDLQKHYNLRILTSNSRNIVLNFLDNQKINCFESVSSEKNIFGKDKSLKKIIKELNLKKDNVVYVGDEVRDIQACQKAGIDIISVSWGLNDFEILKKYKPTYLISDPQDLLNLL